jgi:hypothetical protein
MPQFRVLRDLKAPNWGSAKIAKLILGRLGFLFLIQWQ